MIRLSIIIPAYNEERRIGKTLNRIVEFLSQKHYSWEIILVNDGSTDRTSILASEVIKDERLMIVENPVKKGKGYSVKRGVLISKGETILFSDADLSTPIEELERMLPCLDKGYDIVIGSRSLPDSIIEISQPWYRHGMGKAFNILVRAFLLSGFKDTQCGFKCFKREAALKIFNLQRLSGFSFDVELLYIAKRFGLKIKELPVRWINSPDSKVGIIGGPVSMLMEILRIRFYDWKGYYKPVS